MKQQQLWQILLVTGSVWLGVAIGATASASPSLEIQGKSVSRILRDSPSAQNIPRLSELERPVTSAQMLVQSPALLYSAKPEIVQVTGVKANPTDKGVEVILQTTLGEQLQVVNRTVGNSYIADIPNAQLRLPSGEAFVFRSERPITGITEVTVTNFDANTIRVTVTGTGEAGVPTVELFDSLEEGLIFGIASAAASSPPQQESQTQPTPEIVEPGSETEPDKPSAEGEEEIEIVVTGEQEGGYRVPNTTTGTRTDTPLRDIPLSIQVVPQEVIEDRNVTELGDALETVGGVVSAGGRGTSVFGANFLIRGFDVSDSIFRDGIPYFSLAPLSTNDIERVEVLKGPASVLFGQGEPGGVINLISKKPLNEPFYSASFTAGNFDTYRGNLDFSGPLNASRTVKYRLNISYENYDSFRNFVDGERLVVSPTLAWDIGPNTSINFYGQYTNNQETIDEGIVAFEDGIVDVPRDRFLGEEFGEFEQEQFNLGYTLNHRLSENWSIRQALQYTQYKPIRFAPLFDSFNEETGELSRLEYYADGTYNRFFTNAEVVGKFNTGSIQHQLLFGTEYRRNTEDPRFQFSDLYTSINVFNPIYTGVPYEIAPDFFRDDSIDTIGVYLQDQIDLLPNLKVLAGIRYDYVDQFRTVQNLGEPRQEFEQTDSDFSPRFGIVYQPIETISLYASYTTSFNPSSAASLNADDSTFDPETGRQFEVGIKADLFDRLSLTFAAFDIRRQNVSTPDPENRLFSIQTGEVASRGLELNLGGEILPGWNITASYTYLDAFVSKDTDNINNKLANVPDNQISLWTTYQIQQGNLEGLGFGLGLFYVSERQGDLDNTFELPNYFRTDAALFYKRNNWRAQLTIENLFDVEYFSSASYGSRLGVNPGAPFTILGTFSVEL